MKKSKTSGQIIIALCGIVVLLGLIIAKFMVGDLNVVGTVWSLLPPVIAIVMAFVTKEVYSSLFVGIFAGAVMATNFDLPQTLWRVVDVTASELGGNGGILVFLVCLGIIVAMMERTGCAAALGRWSSKKITTKTGALIATTFVGLAFFIDDYFNCLTTGNVMRPVTDSHTLSRARLAYNIDCTAAPLCIIMPFSSWAAAVISYLPDEYASEGFMIHVRTIPFNYYALLTLFMLFALALMRFDFGPMAKYEKMAEEDGDIYGGTGDLYAETNKTAEDPRGTVWDMLLPVIVLVISCIGFVLYTGGMFQGETVSLFDAFANCDSFVGLPMGGLVALFFTIVWYFLRRIISVDQFIDAIPDGFHLMVPAILILVFSWGLSTICRDGEIGLGATQFVRGFMEQSSFPMALMPFVLYIIGSFVSFSTGTSWGTFGILIPIVCAMFPSSSDPLFIISMAAALGGSVTGDHCSPISETAIMSSTAAQVDFMQHVMTQIPYAGFVAVMSAIGFLLAGFIQNVYICLALVLVLTFLVLWVIKKFFAKSGFARVRKIR